MAKDVSLLYDLLKQYLRHTEGYKVVTTSDIEDLLLGLHEKLFHIFYNKYHYINVDPYVPSWIDLDAHY
jgi:hypothetical protein